LRRGGWWLGEKKNEFFSAIFGGGGGGGGGIALTVDGIDKTSRVFRPSFNLAASFYKR